MSRSIDYKIGDTIAYSPFGGGRRVVTVTDRDENIKNGRAGFDGTTADGMTFWGYDSQILSVVKRACCSAEDPQTSGEHEGDCINYEPDGDYADYFGQPREWDTRDEHDPTL